MPPLVLLAKKARLTSLAFFSETTQTTVGIWRVRLFSLTVFQCALLLVQYHFCPTAQRGMSYLNLKVKI